MAITLSTGATVSVASAYDAADTITTITNASEGSATTSAAHGITVGDYVEITSGWDLLTGRIVRAGAGTSGSTLVLEGIDTSDTVKFPPGNSAGTARKVTSWTQLSQVKSVSASGGSQNFANITAISDLVEKQVPTTRSAVTMTLDVYDDPSLPWYAAVVDADEAKSPYGLKMTFPNGSKLVASAYWSLMRVPTMNQNEALMTQISLSYAAEPVRYAT